MIIQKMKNIQGLLSKKRILQKKNKENNIITFKKILGNL